MTLKTMLAATAAFALFAGTASAAELIYGSHTQDTHSDNSYVAKRFFDRITEATDGEQTFKIMGGGVLAAGDKELGAVSSGAIDATILIYSYTPSEVPALSLLGDLYGSDARVSAAATSEVLLLNCPECKKEQDEHNVVIFQNTSTANYTFLCADQKITNPDDLKGLRIRGTGVMSRTVASLGATPVNATYGEIYEGLQRGSLDCTLLDAGNLEAGQFWDVAKEITMAPLGTFASIGFVAINKDVWEGFTPEQQNAWWDSAAESIRDYEWNAIDRQRRALKISSEEKGATISEAGLELVQAIQDFRAAEIPDLVATAQDRGVEDPQAIVDAYLAARDKWQGIVSEIGEGDWSEAQWDEYTARLKTEIYDNLKTH
ncbi:C4-dicarboxylate TRAP transporter substrate-binding protein [Tropicimonas isoalkanivorans]|uniref:TRAP-type C4-dicarboxylate transport system, substrate-binding protein n=1 Tax=Tropicimonas isoalkanivorans TaxID=441112 RepID=A0A1I1I0R1_9RHOB|nr:C4-dicarboxylate TRAP transporter substrate-binding protein [Tropicimonas isoalkanivorans]SFC29784.1 TRAP-type C4-dicarboxylate transport system, substrate-binding protein [Tropicimonas isoalkanivorans]